MTKHLYFNRPDWWLAASIRERGTIVGILALIAAAGVWISLHPSDSCFKGQIALEQATADVAKTPSYDQPALCDVYKSYLAVLDRFPTDWPSCMHGKGDQRGAWLAAQTGFYSQLVRTKCA